MGMLSAAMASPVVSASVDEAGVHVFSIVPLELPLQVVIRWMPVVWLAVLPAVLSQPYPPILDVCLELIRVVGTEPAKDTAFVLDTIANLTDGGQMVATSEIVVAVPAARLVPTG